MDNSNVSVTMKCENYGVLKGLIEVLEHQDRVEKGLGKISKASKDAAAGQEAMARAAKRMTEEMWSDQQRYNAKIAEAQKLYDAGKISVATYAQKVRAETETLRQSSAAYHAEMAAGKQQYAAAAEVHNRHLAREKQLANEAARAHEALAREAKRVYEETRTPAEEHQARLARYSAMRRAGVLDEEAYARAVQASQVELEKAASSGEKAAGAGMLASVKKLAGGWGIPLGVGAAIAYAGKQLSDFLAEYTALQKQLAETQRETSGRDALVLASGGDASRMGDLKAKARTLYATGATKTFEESAGIIAKLQMAGAVDESAMFGYATGLMDPNQVIDAAKKIRTSFGVEDAGRIKDLVNKALAAAPGSEIGATLAAVAEAAPSARELGIKDEEVFAAVGTMGKVFGMDQAGGKLNRLLQIMTQKGFRDTHAGQTLGEMLQGAGELELNGPEELEIFGARGMAAAQLLDPEAMAAKAAAVGRAPNQIENLARLRTTDRAVRASQMRQAAENLSEINREQQGITENEIQALFASMKAASEGSIRGRAMPRLSALGRWWEIAELQAYRERVGDAAFLEEFRGDLEGLGRQIRPELLPPPPPSMGFTPAGPGGTPLPEVAAPRGAAPRGRGVDPYEKLRQERLQRERAGQWGNMDVTEGVAGFPGFQTSEPGAMEAATMRNVQASIQGNIETATKFLGNTAGALRDAALVLTGVFGRGGALGAKPGEDR